MYSRATRASNAVTFGKYKCQPISYLLNDFNYCQWLVQQEWVHAPKCPADVRKYVEVRDQVLRHHPSLIQLVPGQYASSLPSDILLLNSNVYTSQHSDSETDSVEWNSEEELMNQDTDQEEESQVYIVDKVLDHEQRPDGMYYLIKWQGYPNSENTHEHERDVSTNLLAVYWKNKYFQSLHMYEDVKPWDEVPSTQNTQNDDDDSEDELIQVANSGYNSPHFEDTGYINIHSIQSLGQVEEVAPLRRSARLQARRPAW